MSTSNLYQKVEMSQVLPVTVIILTYNEEKNIEACLDSVYGWTKEIFIVDSFSTDQTLEKVKKYSGVHVLQHAFENYSIQRNWALKNLPITGEFIMNIDADHRINDDLKQELFETFSKGVSEEIKGLMASRQTLFMNRWIKHGGHFPVYHGFMFRKGYGFCEEKEYDQHFVIEGKSLKMKGTIKDVITDSLTNFTARHNRWATLEAQDAVKWMKGNSGKVIQPNKNGNPMEVRRYQRMKYYSLPIFTRVFMYFGYRYFLKFGFLDGKQGLVFHFLQGFWFRFLVDAKIYESTKTDK